LRSPVRPNPIAAAVTRLKRIEGNKLFVVGLDCVDGHATARPQNLFRLDRFRARRFGRLARFAQALIGLDGRYRLLCSFMTTVI
jgi:hypothetical protein